MSENKSEEVVNGVVVDHSHDRVFYVTFGAVLGFLIALTIVISIIAGAISPDPGMTDLRRGQVSERIAPVGGVYTSAEALAAAAPAAAATEADTRSGSEVVAQVCSGCHAAGVLGSIRLDDTAGWSARLAEAGLDALVQSVINGKGAMPPRGGAPGLSDAQVRESVLAILEGAGVDVP